MPLAGFATTIRQRLILLVVGASVYPALMSLLFWPTPSDDLRELINWGLQFPLYTWKLPPLQSWLIGAVALTGARDSWLYLLVAEAINLVALFYLCRIVDEFVGSDTKITITIAYVVSIYFWFIFESGMNADQIQAPLWLGLLYHLLCGIRDDRWRDWLASALFGALAMLAKYFIVLFAIALGIAFLVTPSHRRIFSNPKFYVAVALACIAVAPDLIEVVTKQNTLQYDLATFDYHRSALRRFQVFSALWVTALYCAPFLITLIGIPGRSIVARPPANDSHRVIVLTTALLIGILSIFVFGFGFEYRHRYGAPLFPLLLLTATILIRIDPHANLKIARNALIFGGVIVAGTICWGLFGPPNKLQEPDDAVAHILRDEWQHRYKCGPAYVLGTDTSAHSVGLYYGRPVIGAVGHDFDRAQWIKQDELRRHGGILIAKPGPDAFFDSKFPSATAVETITQPYRRSWTGAEQTYLYRFIPPEGC